MKINDLIKHRSVTACMKEAYSLMTGNVKNLLKSTWWAFMIYAFMVAFMVYLRTPNKMLHDWGEENMMLSFCLQTVVVFHADHLRQFLYGHRSGNLHGAGTRIA